MHDSLTIPFPVGKAEAEAAKLAELTRLRGENVRLTGEAVRLTGEATRLTDEAIRLIDENVRLRARARARAKARAKARARAKKIAAAAARPGSQASGAGEEARTKLCDEYDGFLEAVEYEWNWSVDRRIAMHALVERVKRLGPSAEVSDLFVEMSEHVFELVIGATRINDDLFMVYNEYGRRLRLIRLV